MRGHLRQTAHKNPKIGKTNGFSYNRHGQIKLIITNICLERTQRITKQYKGTVYRVSTISNRFKEKRMTNQTKDLISERQEYYQSLMDKLSIESSSAETNRPDSDKDLYIEKLEKQVDSLKSLVDDMTEKSKNMEKEARKEFNEELQKIDGYYNTLRARFGKIRQSGGEAWTELETATSSAFEEFTKGVKNAISKFK